MKMVRIGITTRLALLGLALVLAASSRRVEPSRSVANLVSTATP